jgi:hypothetical protein
MCVSRKEERRGRAVALWVARPGPGGQNQPLLAIPSTRSGVRLAFRYAHNAESKTTSWGKATGLLVAPTICPFSAYLSYLQYLPTSA